MSPYCINIKGDIVWVDLGNNLATQIDKRFFDLLYCTIKSNTNLRRIKARDRYYVEFTHKNNRKYLLHRWLLNFPRIGHHINGDSLDNRINNLQDSNYSRNSISRHKIHDHSVIKIIHISTYNNTFRVKIKKDGKEYSKGGFKTIEEAKEYHKIILKELYPDDYKSIFKLNGYID